MVAAIRLYFDGDRELRGGFHAFFGEIINQARARKIEFSLIAGGGHPVRDFMKALRTHPESMNLLLIDSESPDLGTLFHDRSRRKDWQPPRGKLVEELQVLWMVQCMETWMIADREALAKYYGKDFHENKLPSTDKLEKIPVEDVISGLADAARDTKKGKYHKTRHAPELLSRINPEKSKACPHCRRSFEILSGLIQT